MPNKLTTDVKTMILTALTKAGGSDYLARQADENPPAFMSLLGKLCPHEVKGDLTIRTLEDLLGDIAKRRAEKSAAVDAQSLAGHAS